MIIEEDGCFRLRGPITIWTAARMLESLRALGHGRGPGAQLRLDLTEVGFVDSAALALLFALMKANHEAGRKLALIGVPDQLHSLAALYDLDDMLPLEAPAVAASDPPAATARPGRGAFLRASVGFDRNAADEAA
jgi:phospholipid transport system transporter-binding protein